MKPLTSILLFAVGLSLTVATRAEVAQVAQTETGKAVAALIAGLRERAEAGDATAQFQLGKKYQTSDSGVAVDRFESARWLRLAANQGHARAQFMFCTSIGYLDSTAAEREEWFSNLRAEAEAGNGDAQYCLGCLLLFTHEPTDPRTDNVHGWRWLGKAADQGIAEAEWYLATRFEHGRGVPADKVEAVKWYRKAAEHGNGDAQFRLGTMCFFGVEGPKPGGVSRLLGASSVLVRQDRIEAAKWFRKASDQQVRWAAYRLGKMHSVGLGVPKSQIDADAWYHKGPNFTLATGRFRPSAEEVSEDNAFDAAIEAEERGQAAKRG